MALPGRHPGFAFTPRHWLVPAEPSDNGRCPVGVAHGRVAQETDKQGAGSFGSRLPIYQHGLGVIPEASQCWSTP
jgi:hypothetical protein